MVVIIGGDVGKIGVHVGKIGVDVGIIDVHVGKLRWRLDVSLEYYCSDR
ncbi:hypothetical protein [Paenisporosarcina sp. NPDC076898]